MWMVPFQVIKQDIEDFWTRLELGFDLLSLKIFVVTWDVALLLAVFASKANTLYDSIVAIGFVFLIQGILA